jgi:membrane-bound ClpP family serine protease
LQNIAFVLVLSGLLLLYCEAIWVGRIYFGLAGAVLFLSGVAGLWNLPHTLPGMTLIAAAILAFVIEAFFRTCFVAGILGTILLASGFWKLCPPPIAIAPGLILPLTALFGVLTLKLFAIAKQARRNKRDDL